MKPIRRLKRFLKRRALFSDCRKRGVHIKNAIFYNRDYINVSIGDNAKLNDAFLDNQCQITIGKDVFFGNSVKILTGSHDYSLFGYERQSTIIPEPVTIDEGVWIASYAIILPGTHIGKHSVIGAGSVVKGEIEPYSVVIGNPGKVTKKINRKDEL